MIFLEHVFKKRYGQNFLHDDNILSKIYSSISPGVDDLIIEIGPGSGNLTKYLMRYNCQVVCFEIDKSLDKYLGSLVCDKLDVFYVDFMDVCLEDVLSHYKYNDVYVIANIPYYITTPIIEKIVFSNINVKSLTLMVQREVADRLSSSCGSKDYGYITAFLGAFYDIVKLFNVPRSCFYPVPNVDSAIIRLNRIECLVADVPFYNKFCKDAFRFKRKNLKNNLFDYDLELISNILIKNGFSLNNRAEDIPINVFIEIVNSLNKKH